MSLKIPAKTRRKNLSKKSSKFTLFLLTLLAPSVAMLSLITFGPAIVYAQDIDKETGKNNSHPSIRKFIFENDRVQVSEIRLRPGQKSEILKFNLPGYMYIAKPGKLRFYWENISQDLNVDDNNSVISISTHHWTESEPPHTVVNIGNKEFLAIRFEIKPSK